MENTTYSPQWANLACSQLGDQCCRLLLLGAQHFLGTGWYLMSHNIQLPTANIMEFFSFEWNQLNNHYRQLFCALQSIHNGRQRILKKWCQMNYLIVLK